MKKEFCCLSKGIFKRVFAIALLLCMLVSLAPKNSLSAHAEGEAKTQTNLALAAERLTNLTLSQIACIERINDGQYDKGTWRNGTAADIEGKDYYGYKWTEPVSVNEVILAVVKAQNQAPVSWHVEVSKDGEDNWTEVASISDVKWESGEEKQTKELTFEQQKDIKGLRVWIDKANLAWGGYSIQELEVYNDPNATDEKNPTTEAPEPELKVPENGNYALVSEVSTNVKQNTWTASWNLLIRLIDGKHDTNIWREGVAADIEGKDYYQFNWISAISVDQVILVVQKAKEQAPVTWHIQVSKDGETGWTDVASISDVAWKTSNNVDKTQTESKKLTFELQKGIKGLRVWIDKANLEWNGYAINEIEIYNSANSPKTGDVTPVVPAMLAALVSTAGAITCTFGYRKNRKRYAEEYRPDTDED